MNTPRMTHYFLKLAVTDPETITPNTGHAFERFVAGNITPAGKTQDDFVKEVMKHFFHIKEMDEDDMVRLWFGCPMAPAWTKTHQGREIKLINAIADGSVTTDNEIEQFCRNNGIWKIAPAMRKAKSVKLFREFLINLDMVDIDLLPVAAAGFWLDANRQEKTEAVH